MSSLPPYVTRELVLERLPLIFPVGTPNRNYCIREMAASTIFTMLYIGAVKGNGIFLGPVYVYRMTHEQAALVSDHDRITYRNRAIRPGFTPTGVRWYADNTREPIRDETLQEGLIQVGAVSSIPIATTSSKPRYSLKKDFADLFNPALEGETFEKAVTEWRVANLSKSALTRLSLAALASREDDDLVLITFPNKETRSLTGGPSTDISKAVIEVFAHKYLESPGVLWLSTSDSKITIKDDRLATQIGLKITAEKNLPDIILVDLAPSHPLLVFVEVVATDGAVTEKRKQSIFEITDQAGFLRKQILFVTAYKDRQSAGFSKTFKGLAWNSFVWFVSEPDNIVIFREGVFNLSELS